MDYVSLCHMSVGPLWQQPRSPLPSDLSSFMRAPSPTPFAISIILAR